MRFALAAVFALLTFGLAIVGARGDGQPLEFVFVPDTSRIVRLEVPVWQSANVTHGHLDGAGNFIPLSHPKDPQPTLRDAAEDEKIPVINRPTGDTDEEPAYEFRSGLLIKGRLKRDKGFVPEQGSRIIAFEDYKYSPSAPRIYNLPGRFAPKQSAPPKDK